MNGFLLTAIARRAGLTRVLLLGCALLDLLASEEVYYLEPRFIEMGAFEWASRGADLLGTPGQPVDRVSAAGG